MITAFVTLGYDWMVYLGLAIGILDYSSNTMFRSIISKNVQANEVGRVFSVVGIFETLMPFAVAPLFGFLYKATVETQPNAFLLLVVGLKAAVLITMTTILISVKLEPKRNIRLNSVCEAKEMMHCSPNSTRKFDGKREEGKTLMTIREDS